MPRLSIVPMSCVPKKPTSGLLGMKLLTLSPYYKVVNPFVRFYPVLAEIEILVIRFDPHLKAIAVMYSLLSGLTEITEHV